MGPARRPTVSTMPAISGSKRTAPSETAHTNGVSEWAATGQRVAQGQPGKPSGSRHSGEALVQSAGAPGQRSLGVVGVPLSRPDQPVPVVTVTRPGVDLAA